MTRIFDPKRKSAQASAIGQGASDVAEFAADGTAPVDVPALFLAQFGGAQIVGEPGLDEVEGTAGNASHTITVPAGKYWRLVGMFHLLVCDANAANRQVVVLTRTDADATIETITHAIETANNTQKAVTLFGTDDNVRGDRAVAAQGKLTIAEPVTDTDQFSLNGVEFTLLDALTGAANEILIGGSEAATKLALNNAFVQVTRDANVAGSAALHSVSDAVLASLEMTAAVFAGDVLKFTANVKGTAGNSLATAETGNGLTHGSNVFDAATLGTETAGLDAADKVSTLDHPTAGPYLGPAEDINISVTNGVAGDSLDTYLIYLEFDAAVD